MPVIQPKHVVSFTSEDKIQCADNLLKPETYRKWRTATAGEGQASLVLQLEKAEQIHSIDIGNEGSTFIEVLVGKDDAQVKIDFEVLLGASAFMTPAESKSWINTNKVRFFGPEKLNKMAREQKWSRIKIVTTQNFNKMQPFGLAFIKFHSPPDTTETKATESTKKFGMFSLKEDGSSSPKPITAGSLFDKVKREPVIHPPAGGAAALRCADFIPISPTPTGMFTLKKEKETVPTPRSLALTSIAQTPLKATNVQSNDSPKPSPVAKPKVENSNSVSRKRPSSPNGTEDVSSSAPKKIKPEKPCPPFDQLLGGVVFTLSGYQNPLRGRVRDKALEMGAKYRPDWDSSCTHLICAFSNTPKFSQVLGKGKIVTKKWVEDCHNERKRHSWRDYRLDDGSSGSDSENGTKPMRVKKKENSRTREDKALTNTEPNSKCEKTMKDDPSQVPEDSYAGTTDVDTDIEEPSVRPGVRRNDDPDTEDELEKVLYQSKKTNDHLITPKTKPTKEDESTLPPLPKLPDFFSGKTFMLFGSHEAQLLKLLKRFIIGYGGTLVPYMSSSVNFVVTTSLWNSNFDDAIAENPLLNFVRPKWLKVCHQKLKIVPHQSYIVAPPLEDDDDDD